MLDKPLLDIQRQVERGIFVLNPRLALVLSIILPQRLLTTMTMATKKALVE